MDERTDDRSRRIELRDGTHVLIRMVEPDDKDGFVAGFRRLSTRSRYLRFHTGLEHLSEQQLRYLTEVDGTDHVAWVAVDLDDPERPGIGVARFVRVKGEPTVAEAAVTVVDDRQGLGLGSALLEMLAAAAVRRGISSFRAYVLGQNRAVLQLLESLGPTCSTRLEDVWQVDVALTGREPVSPTSQAGRVFRAVTGKRLPAMHTTAPPAWLAEDDPDGVGQRGLKTWIERIHSLGPPGTSTDR